MNKEIIEKYIKFGIDNWFKDLDWYKFLWLKYEIDNILWEFETANWKYCIQLLWDNILEIITSKDFIKAITRWLIRQRFSKNALEENIQNAFKSSVFQWKIKEITHNQADAIRDWKLEEFILSLNI